MVAGRHRSYANTQVTREATSSNMFVHAVRWFSWKSAGCAAVHHVENYLVNLGGWSADIVGVTATTEPKMPKRAATKQTTVLHHQLANQSVAWGGSFFVRARQEY